MSDTQHVLDALDGALLDYTISDDAMRWTPEPSSPAPTGLQFPNWRSYTPPTSQQIQAAVQAFGESLQRRPRAIP